MTDCVKCGAYLVMDHTLCDVGNSAATCDTLELFHPRIVQILTAPISIQARRGQALAGRGSRSELRVHFVAILVFLHC